MNSDDPAILQQEDEQDELSELMTEWKQEFWEKWREDAGGVASLFFFGISLPITQV